MSLHISWIGNAVIIADFVLRVGLSLRVIMRRLPVGVSLAWLSIIFVLPFVGAILYLLVGEYRLGPRRGRRAIRYQKAHRGELNDERARIDPEALEGRAEALARLCEATIDAAALGGNRLRL